MADIAFLLIVFFMVTSTFAATKGLDFTLPSDNVEETFEGTPDREEAVYIHVTTAGVFVDCKAMELSEILGYLKPKLDVWRNKTVILHTDLDANYRDMVQVYDELAKGKAVLGYEIPNISVPTAKDLDKYTKVFGYNPFELNCTG